MSCRNNVDDAGVKALNDALGGGHKFENPRLAQVVKASREAQEVGEHARAA